MFVAAMEPALLKASTSRAKVVRVPGAKPGDEVDFGGLLGRTVVLDVGPFTPKDFISRGGEVPHYKQRL